MLLAAACAVAGDAMAAGGHHAVDDATLLDPGQCQVETWFDRHPVAADSLSHLGPGCRVGPVEVGFDLDRYRHDAMTQTYTSAQIKYALALNPTWSIGLAALSSARDHASRYAGSSIVMPVTWTLSETLLAHFNVGRDLIPGRPDTPRNGAALEWSPAQKWSFITERFQEAGDGFWRVGARYALTPMLNVDASTAHDTRVDAPRRWTVGLTWVMTR